MGEWVSGWVLAVKLCGVSSVQSRRDAGEGGAGQVAYAPRERERRSRESGSRAGGEGWAGGG